MSLYQLMDIKKQEIQLFLVRPDLQVIHKFKDVNDRRLTVKFDDLHELSFSIPYKIDMNHQLIDNPAIALVRERFVVKIVFGQLEEHFVINKIGKSSNSDGNFLTISCFHLPYELKYKRYRSYSAASYNCLQVTNDCLDSTPWKVGYIDPSFNIKYRQFDLSSGNRLDFLNEIGKSFKAIKTYDTTNRLVNFYQESDLSKYKGLNIKEGQYIDGISNEVDLDQLVTRLYLYGSEDLTINEVSPNGQSYVEDFSHFLYPFAMDDNGNVILHSDYGMSDALCKSIINHAKLIEENQTTLSGYFNQISTIQEEITAIQNIIDADNSQLAIVDDNIKIALSEGLSTTALNEQRTTLVNDINTQKKVIKGKNQQIDVVKQKINDLKNTLVLENYLKSISQESLIDELQLYIIEDEFIDDNIIDATDLYNEGLTELSKRNSPPVNISISLIDFLAILEESYNWDKLNVGDLVNIIHPSLGIKIRAKIAQIDYNFESQSITLGITNGNRILTPLEKVIRSSYHNNKTSKDYQNRKINWNKIAYNFDNRNDRISDIPADPSFSNNSTDIGHVKNDDGSVTLTVNWQFPTDTSKNEYNIDGFNIYLYASKYKEDITLGSMSNDEASFPNVSADARKYTIPSVPANQYYYIGIQSYRRVDNDISSNGVLLSDIITSKHNESYPYLPEETVDIQGRVNGVKHTTGDEPPENAQINDTWMDTNTNTSKIYTETDGWVATSAGSASSVGGYVPSATVEPSTVVVRTETGDIAGNITGSATTLNGLTETDFAQLNESGKISVDVIPQTIVFGTYTGTGVQSRTITLNFTPRMVKVYTTDSSSDESVFITSINGGYKINSSTRLYLVGNPVDATPSLTYGKLEANGFVVGNSIDLYSNKSSVLYYYEAYL